MVRSEENLHHPHSLPSHRSISRDRGCSRSLSTIAGSPSESQLDRTSFTGESDGGSRSSVAGNFFSPLGNGAGSARQGHGHGRPQVLLKIGELFMLFSH